MAGRYDAVEVASIRVDDGAGSSRDVRYLRRRTVPGAPAQVLARHQVVEDDRLDLVTARYLGDPTAFWRVCDANAALDPDALVAPDAAGTVLVIPVPEA